ncbi:calcium-independent phospholipase A2-gamma-like isoform X1 [Notothenia coriiceps]|uniref:Calcium-independent phospholipase A2-gamma-like isoform X1 n=2 Tax=Notothenia coriiceps TaxID=8208 RepID=A0A6I9NSG0_9TELE|nr:PREDICTED: calcium-independent phospholipase A2-gamma-like isoform X1 [Notothenia coriiceps]
MGRYLGTNFCSSSVNKTLRSYCKSRYLMSLLRKYHCLARTPPGLDLHRYSLLTHLHPSRFTKITTLKNVIHSDTSSASNNFLRDFTKELNHLQVVRFYSSSNRNTFKPEAPIGILEETQKSFLLSSLGGRFGQSFKRLSRHINIYFKRKDVEPLAENDSLVAITPEHLGGSQRRGISQRATRERNISEGKDTTQPIKSTDTQESSGTSPSTQDYSGLQLFHISSLATTFGESYSYVASHINSVFPAKAQMQDNLETMSSTRANKRLNKRQMQNPSIKESKEAEIPQVQSGTNQATVEPTSVSSSWEESYQHYARHINTYFGAKVTGKEDHDLYRREHISVQQKSTYKEPFSKQSTSQTQSALSQLVPDEPAIDETGGLFHSSTNTTNFGENYSQTGGYINQFFFGQSRMGEDEDIESNLITPLDPGSATSERPKTASFLNYLRHPTSAIPDFLGSLTQTCKPRPAMTSPQPMMNQKFVLSRRQAEEMAQRFIGTLTQTSSPEDLTSCLAALNEHLICYPSCKAVMWKEKIAVTLLRKRRTFRDNEELQSALRESMALIGYMDPVKGRGIRVLSIDGGGTRGVVPLQVLKILEAETGRKIHELFDYICGVSTGAVLAFMLGLAHFSLEECSEMYQRFGSEVFRQNRLVGTVKMGWSHSYYNTETWEKILREKMGTRILIETARDELSPKVSAVSAVVNWGTSPKAFIFRNYNHKPGSLSRYAGGSACQMWEAVRASSAAPGYFQEFPLQSDIHQDGGIILNNPCALAIHESRLLWPNQPFQCVLSLGTGRFDNVKRGPATSTSLRAKISNLISSATDTEGVHTLLDDLLAPDVYFRFNPMLSAMVSLDESRPQALDQLRRDTHNYLERNQPKLAQLCLVLGAERSAASKTKDWMNERAWEMKQRWV